jgi:hypothetical protein
MSYAETLVNETYRRKKIVITSAQEEEEKYENMTWYEMVEEEDKYVHPIIKKVLEPLMALPGYKYDEIQYKHHQEIAKSEGKDPSTVPDTGYFELSRAYARNVESGKICNVLCARKVPSWIPPGVFKNIFRPYASDNTTEINRIIINQDGSEEEIKDTYPYVNLIEGKKDSGRIVFVTFDPDTKDAIFALLMTRKVKIIHPKNPDLECVLIFDHAYEKGRTSDRSRNKSKVNTVSTRKYKPTYITPQRKNSSDKYVPPGLRTSTPRDDVDISRFNYTKKK